MIAVLYEHPEWFIPLFNALERRSLPYTRIDAAALAWDPARPPSFSLLINRMSPSAYLRGRAHAIPSAAAFLGYVERHGVPVVNGLAAYRLETSKAAQLDLFERLGVRYPRARVINHPAGALAAADGLRFPVVIKPNIGGSGAKILRFDSPRALAGAAEAGTLDLGIDHTALVQEYLPARGGSITRIELLDGEFLYAIRITPPAGFGFNLCPADICREDSETEAAAPVQALPEVCPVKPAMQIEATSVAPDILEAAIAIAEAAALDICGIEFLVDDRDGEAYFYDVNALSNFVTDAERIVGFDPFDRFVDYVERRLTLAGTGPRPRLLVEDARVAEF